MILVHQPQKYNLHYPCNDWSRTRAIFIRSDFRRFGRKRVAMILMIGYFIASMISVFTTHLTLFLIMRFIQGLTSGGAIVIAKASVGDNMMVMR